MLMPSLEVRHQLLFFLGHGRWRGVGEEGKVGQFTTPQGSRRGKEGKHVCDFGFNYGTGGLKRVLVACRRCTHARSVNYWTLVYIQIQIQPDTDVSVADTNTWSPEYGKFIQRLPCSVWTERHQCLTLRTKKQKGKKEWNIYVGPSQIVMRVNGPKAASFLFSLLVSCLTFLSFHPSISECLLVVGSLRATASVVSVLDSRGGSGQKGWLRDLERNVRQKDKSCMKPSVSLLGFAFPSAVCLPRPLPGYRSVCFA